MGISAQLCLANIWAMAPPNSETIRKGAISFKNDSRYFLIKTGLDTKQQVPKSVPVRLKYVSEKISMLHVFIVPKAIHDQRIRGPV